MDIETINNLTISQLRERTKEYLEHRQIEKEHKLADENLTKCLKELKWKNK